MQLYYVLLGVVLGIILDIVFTPTKKNSEGKYVSNLVVVDNTDSCNNQCVHIHHWMWGGVFALYSFLLNPSHMFSNVVIGIWIGSFIAELTQFGTNIFQVRQKCFTKCASQ